MEANGFVVVDHPERAEFLEKANAWLRSTDFFGDGSEYRKHLGAVAPGTTEWLFDTEQFRTWWTGTAVKGNILHLRGVPGSGKSTLAASVIRRLAEDSTVAFGFLRRIVSTNNTSAFLARDFITQLLSQTSKADHFVQTFLADRDGDAESASDQELWRLLAGVLRHVPRVTLVIDALDEILPGQEAALVEVLRQLAVEGDGAIKVMITSRPASDLNTPMQGFDVGIIRLVGVGLEEDVRRYTSHRLEHQNERALQPEELRLIQEHLRDSLFLQARLTLDEVLGSSDSVLGVLQRLPGSLSDLYTEVLTHHAAGSGSRQSLQYIVLLWTSHACRPLRLVEVAAVATFQGMFDNISAAKAEIRDCCGPLIEIRKDETVHVCHHSFAEFLLHTDWLLRCPDHVMNPSNPDNHNNHFRIAQFCVNYLCSGALAAFGRDEQVFEERLLPEISVKFPLVAYASRYWPSHATRVHHLDSELFRMLDTLLGPGIGTHWNETKTWARISQVGLDPDVTGYESIHLGSHLGLKSYVEYLLRRPELGQNNQQNSLGQTPLMLAVDGGHVDTVRLLLGHDASFDNVNTGGMTAVHIAVIRNRPECLRELTAAGASIFTLVLAGSGPVHQSAPPDFVGDEILQQSRVRGRSSEGTRIFAGCSPTQLACEMGLTAILRVILPLLDHASRTSIPLHWAAAGGHADVLELLLSFPEIKENVNTRNTKGNTPLFLASRCANPRAAVQALLNNGADPQVLSDDGGAYYERKTRSIKKHKGHSHFGVAPLIAWAGMSALTSAWQRAWAKSGAPLLTATYEEYLEAGELLLRHGADPNARTPDGRTALFMWSEDTHGGGDANTGQVDRQAAFVELLLRHGANPKAEDKTGTTILHLLKGSPEEMPAVTLLVRAGADLNAPDTATGKTPIHNLFPEHTGFSRNIPVFSQLAALGADFKRGDKKGDTPLHLAVSACSQSHDSDLVTKVMTEILGLCDPGIKNARRETGLFRLRANMFHRQFGCISRSLMAAGIDLETRDIDGKTALLEAARWRDESLIGLLDIGADIQARDNNGRTCLHYLFGTQSPNSAFYALKTKRLVSLVRTIQDRGLALDVVDNNGNTILHEAAGDRRGWSHQVKDLLRGLETLLELGLLGPHMGTTASLILKKNHAGQTALHRAAAVVSERTLQGGSEDDVDAAMFDILLKHDVEGISRDAKDARGETPLHLAAGRSEARTWKLLAAGANVTAASGDGNIPLHNAVRGLKANCVSLLCQAHLKLGVSVDIRNENDETPLHEAGRAGNLLVTKLLLSAGADSTAVNSDGQTALQIAESVPHTILPPAEAASIVSYVLRVAKDKNKAAGRWKLEDGPEGSLEFGKPPLDIVLGALDVPDHAAVVQVMSGKELSIPPVTDVHRRDPLVLPYRSHSQSSQNLEAGNDQYGHEAEKLDLTGELLEAILLRKYHELSSLIARGADPTLPLFEDHESLAHVLVRTGATTALELLLPHFGDINALRPPLLHIAAERKESNMPCVEQLLANGADPNTDYEEGDRSARVSRFPVWIHGKHTVMHIIARGIYSWHAEALALLVQHGGDLTRKDGTLHDCLQLSKTNERQNIKAGPYGTLCTEVIQATQTPDEPDSDAAEGLLQLIMDGDVEGVQELLDAGADPNAIYDHDGVSMIPLEACATFWDEGVLECQSGDDGIPDIMTALLAAGADPYLPVADGATPAFHFACEKNAPMGPFVDAGVDLETPDCSGATPLIVAAGWYGYVPQGGRDAAACALVAAGADVRAADTAGQTALHRAATSESHLTNPMVMDALLAAGARADAKDGDGHDAFYYFLRTDGVDMEHYKVPTLRDMFCAGVDVGDADPDTGETNLHALLGVIGTELGEGRGSGYEFVALMDIHDGMIAGGADGEARDNEGRTPVFRFVEALAHRTVPEAPGWAWCRSFLQRRDVRVVSGAGDTLLHVLARQPRLRGGWTLDDKATMFRLLMELGADPRRENAEGMSAVDIAAAHEDGTILAIFEESQA